MSTSNFRLLYSYTRQNRIYPPKKKLTFFRYFCPRIYSFSKLVCAIAMILLIIFAEYAILGCCLEHVWIVTEVDTTYNLRMVLRSRRVLCVSPVCLSACLCDTCVWWAFSRFPQRYTHGDCTAAPRATVTVSNVRCVRKLKIESTNGCAASCVHIASLALLLLLLLLPLLQRQRVRYENVPKNSLVGARVASPFAIRFRSNFISSEFFWMVWWWDNVTLCSMCAQFLVFAARRFNVSIRCWILVGAIHSYNWFDELIKMRGRSYASNRSNNYLLCVWPASMGTHVPDERRTQNNLFRLRYVCECDSLRSD